VRWLLTASVVLLASCSAQTHSSSAISEPARSAFHILGDPESAQGAIWTYKDTVKGVRYDLHGVLLKPPGPGPFPAVVLSHGFKGNAAGYGIGLGAPMVQWGLVCIAVDYTHAAGVPIGSPGNASERGATRPNVLRAHRAYEMLRSLPYVDMTRVAAHGHSMGAYVTAALVSAYPGDFRVASHTGGGVRPNGLERARPAPIAAQLRGIRVPYQMHHGESDMVVPLSFDRSFDSILAALGVPHELYIYPGADHAAPSRSPVMLERVRQWYTRHGMF
jgi:dienelactone hydrolase